MDVREKLVEIISHAPCCGFSSRAACEHIADHLIANGVTVQEMPRPEPPKGDKHG